MADLIGFAKTYAAQHEWNTELIDSKSATLKRVDDNELDSDYSGPVTGLILQPGGDCEPIRLEFDSDLHVQDYTKTQFAGATIHSEVVDFLRGIAPYFETFRVKDEGEYWETGDQLLLQKHLAACNQSIEDMLREHPNAEVKERMPNGRIVDIVTYH
jgi:hypothetical protein